MLLITTASSSYFTSITSCELSLCPAHNILYITKAGHLRINIEQQSVSQIKYTVHRKWVLQPSILPPSAIHTASDKETINLCQVYKRWKVHPCPAVAGTQVANLTNGAPNGWVAQRTHILLRLLQLKKQLALHPAMHMPQDWPQLPPIE